MKPLQPATYPYKIRLEPDTRFDLFALSPTPLESGQPPMLFENNAPILQAEDFNRWYVHLTLEIGAITSGALLEFQFGGKTYNLSPPVGDFFRGSWIWRPGISAEWEPVEGTLAQDSKKETHFVRITSSGTLKEAGSTAITLPVNWTGLRLETVRLQGRYIL